MTINRPHEVLKQDFIDNIDHWFALVERGAIVHVIDPVDGDLFMVPSTWYDEIKKLGF